MAKLAINPWRTMWTKPRDTIKTVTKTDPNYRLWWLAGFYGFPMLLNLAQNFSLSEKLSPLFVVIGAIILSAFVGMIGFQITSALMLWTGRWLGGAADFLEIRAAVAWSNVTNIATCLLWILLIALFGSDLFLRSFPEGLVAVPSALAVMRSFILVGMSVLSIWSFVLLVISLAEVQKFSIWRAIGNIILPYVIVSIALWAVFIFVFWAAGMKS